MSCIVRKHAICNAKNNRATLAPMFLYTRKVCLWAGILFSCCPCVRLCVCVSVMFCFLNILKSR